jgi:hypothetical protein
MNHEKAAPLVVKLAKEFISLVRDIDPEWRKAYLRFSDFDAVAEAKASYRTDSKVVILDVRKYRQFFDDALEQGAGVLSALGRGEGVVLLEVNCDFDYEFHFEYEDRNRWSISKLSGGTGVPAGME